MEKQLEDAIRKYETATNKLKEIDGVCEAVAFSDAYLAPPFLTF